MNYKEQYNNIKSVFNPYFEEKIIFDMQGWKHLQTDGNGENRSKQEFLERLSFLDLITIFLADKFPPTEYKYIQYEKSYWVKYYTFVYAYCSKNGDEFRLKAVIREKSNKPKHFYSLIKAKHQKYEKK